MLCCLVRVNDRVRARARARARVRKSLEDIWQFGGTTTFSLAIANRDMASDRGEQGWHFFVLVLVLVLLLLLLLSYSYSYSLLLLLLLLLLSTIWRRWLRLVHRLATVATGVAAYATSRTRGPSTSKRGEMPRPGALDACMNPFWRCGAPVAVLTVT